MTMTKIQVLNRKSRASNYDENFLGNPATTLLSMPTSFWPRTILKKPVAKKKKNTYIYIYNIIDLTVLYYFKLGLPLSPQSLFQEFATNQ